MSERQMQISEVAERTSPSLRTIRYHEEVRLVRPSARSQGGFRGYTDTDVERLRSRLDSAEGFAADLQSHEARHTTRSGRRRTAVAKPPAVGDVAGQVGRRRAARGPDRQTPRTLHADGTPLRPLDGPTEIRCLVDRIEQLTA
jgi:hypothetical protein